MELNSICRLCKRNVKEKENSIACDLCDCWQHIKCLKIPIDVHTFMSKQRDGSKFGIFQWICPSCQPALDIVTQCTGKVATCIDVQTKKIEDLECQVAKLTSVVESSYVNSIPSHDNDSNVETELQKLNGSVAALANRISSDEATSSSEKVLNYAEVLKLPAAPLMMTKKEKAKPKEIVYLKPNVVNAEKSPPQMQNMQKCLTEALSSVEVCFMKENNQTGLIALGLPNSESKDKASEIISKSDLDYSLSMYTKSLPKISVSQIPIEVLDSNSNSLEDDRAAVKGAILAKCDVIADLYKDGHTFEVVYVKKHVQYVNAGIKVSPLIRNWVIRRGHLFIGNSSCPVNDRIFIKQCFHCQKIGHVSKNCPAKTESATCLFCAESHRSAACTVKADKTKHTCSNCLVNDRTVGRSNHTANSFDCEHIQKEISRLQRKIEYDSKNVM